MPLRPSSKAESGFTMGPGNIAGFPAGALLLLVAGAFADEHLPDPLAAGWEGEPVCERIHDGVAQRVLRCTFPPGVGHERHYHAPHFGYVLEGGRMRVTDADGSEVVDIQSHTTWQSDGIEWHEVVNVGETTASFLIIEPKR
ncbi:MAG: cupin domain-containing protein [Woeseiaceae bacterium]|nr:cupin domain-containing protein [Woeseiaceae bacterium]